MICHEYFFWIFLAYKHGMARTKSSKFPDVNPVIAGGKHEFPRDCFEVIFALSQNRNVELRHFRLDPTQSRKLAPLRFNQRVLASCVTCGCRGIFPCDRGEGTVIGGADLIQDLIGRIDDVGSEREVLGEGELHFYGMKRGRWE